MTNRVRACHRTTQDVFRRVREPPACACGLGACDLRIEPARSTRTVSPSLRRRSRQRCDDFLRASATSSLSTRVALRLPERVTRRCVRPTSASHHSTTSTRVSWVPDHVTGLPRCCQGDRRFTTSLPLRRAPRCMRRREILSPIRRRRGAEPLTLLSPPHPRSAGAFARTASSGAAKTACDTPS